MKAAFYYSKNLVEVKEIFENIDGGLLVQNAKLALSEDLYNDLVCLKNCYSPILELINSIESRSNSIKDSYEKLSVLNFQQDPANIKTYLKKRISQNDLEDIAQMRNQNISPDLYIKLWNCQSTSCDVERSFSQMGNLLEKDRNFKPENVKFYMICLFNKLL